MNFPSDIKMAMRDCILKIFWPKKDIESFLSDNGCTRKDLAVLGDITILHRNQIIDIMFEHLSNKTDKGLGPFRSMLQALTNWSQFDSYYFDKLAKLSRTDAENSISHLKQLQELRDSKIIQKRKIRERKEKAAQQPRKTLEELKARYLSLYNGSESLSKRGYEFEKILLDLGRLSNTQVTEPFRVQGEQLDGAIKYDGEHYVIEAKWQEQSSANEAVYQFVGKIEGKLYGRGIFISVNGFSSNVIKSLVHGKALKTIFVDGQDLIMVLDGVLSFSDMLDRKIKAAQTKGLIYVNPINGQAKCS